MEKTYYDWCVYFGCTKNARLLAFSRLLEQTKRKTFMIVVGTVPYRICTACAALSHSVLFPKQLAIDIWKSLKYSKRNWNFTHSIETPLLHIWGYASHYMSFRLHTFCIMSRFVIFQSLSTYVSHIVYFSVVTHLVKLNLPKTWDSKGNKRRNWNSNNYPSTIRSLPVCDTWHEYVQLNRSLFSWFTSKFRKKEWK